MTSITAPATDQHGLCCHNPSASETIRLGQAAMERQRRSWEDWLLIAEALAVGRTEVMASVHTNQPTGSRYERAMADWLATNGFKEIDKAARCRLLQCLEHREQIENWRSRLTASERFRFNHPQTVLRESKKSIAGPDPEPKRASPVAKLKDSIIALEEDNHRMRREIERGGGDLWTPQDTARNIASVMLDKLGVTKAKGVHRELAKLIKEAERRSGAIAHKQETVS